ncbi:DUF488 domain-containing protein [Amycolatopsis echigonensis]|uniref:DUF488 domain-containing protein n=1 Tax=Amycolatopsis echigonensis TaxID=2576905 RepID=A0A8E1VUW7_9PSEU|nr:DUF488 domain-containing protein [Amycolatopsis echigonensis]MBB2498758.1 DUF488 domain-containing protein [Amycolatopsis echigonensis]
MNISATRLREGAIGVGYEGQEIGPFVEALARRGVTRLVDVRLTPISRKRGFSKTALGQALAEVGIVYDHRRELGNLKANRAGFAGTEAELAQAKSRYAELLDSAEGQASLNELGRLAASERIAVLCFEADQRRCHRDVVLGEIARRLPRA